MEVLIRTEGYARRGQYKYKGNIDNVADYEALIATNISMKNVWVNGLLIIKDGFQSEFAHNKKLDVVSWLTYDPLDDHIAWVELPWPL